MEILTPPIYGGGASRSFKVIDVGTTGKLVGSACYDKQQVRDIPICKREEQRITILCESRLCVRRLPVLTETESPCAASRHTTVPPSALGVHRYFIRRSPIHRTI